jgi:hypothetical protein
MGVCLLALITGGCAQSGWIAQEGAGPIDERKIFVKPGFITIHNGKASVSPKTIKLVNRHQVAIWVLTEGYLEGDNLEIRFADGEFQKNTDLVCRWRICAMHIPPSLGPEENRKKQYEGTITRKDGSTITLDPQVEIIDF